MSSPPDRQRLPDLFAEADALEPEARRRFVQELAVGEPELARELVELFAAAPGSRERFATPAFERLGTVAGEGEPADDTPLPERLGPYRIVRELGRGGMGRVFLAEEVREAYRRR